MNTTALPYIIGNVCAGLATLVFLVPLMKLLAEFADKHVNNDDWTGSVLLIVAPQWLLLMAALLCVTAVGGFDWLKLGRTTLYGLAVAAAVALAAVSFVFIALYIRPGFTPRFLYVPLIVGVTLSTVLLVALTLNQRFVPDLPLNWLRWPWTVFTGLSVVVCTLFFGNQAVRLGVDGAAQIAQRIANLGPASAERLAAIAAIDPETDFERLLWQATRDSGREVQAAATARLRSHPTFVQTLSQVLTSGHVEPALGFVRDATLTPEEQKALARPSYVALERWVERVPYPNFTTAQHRNRLRRWGTAMFETLPGKFAGMGLDFTQLQADFADRVDPKP